MPTPVSIRERIIRHFVTGLGVSFPDNTVVRLDHRGVMLGDGDIYVACGDEGATDLIQGNNGYTNKEMTFGVGACIRLAEDDAELPETKYNRMVALIEKSILSNIPHSLCIDVETASVDEPQLEDEAPELFGWVQFRCTYRHDRADPFVYGTQVTLLEE